MNQSDLLQVKVKVHIEKEAEDSFVATCPQIGCIFVHEVSEEAAILASHAAIDAYAVMSLENGDPLPVEIIESEVDIKASVRATPLRTRQREMDSVREYELAEA